MFNYAEISNISQKFVQTCKFIKIPLTNCNITAMKEQYQSENFNIKQKSEKAETKTGSRLNSNSRLTMNTLPDYANKIKPISSSSDDAIIEKRHRKVRTDVGETRQTPQGKTLEYLTTSCYKRVSPEFLQLLERNKGRKREASTISRDSSADAAFITKTRAFEPMKAHTSDGYIKTTQPLFDKSNNYLVPEKMSKPLTKTNGNFRIDSPLNTIHDVTRPDPTKKGQPTELTDVDGGFANESFFLKIKENIPPIMIHTNQSALIAQSPIIQVYDDIELDSLTKCKPKGVGVKKIKASSIKINEKNTSLVPTEGPLILTPYKLKDVESCNVFASETKTFVVKNNETITLSPLPKVILDIEQPMKKVYDDINSNILKKTKSCDVSATETCSALFSVDINESNPFGPAEEPLYVEPPFMKLYDVENADSSKKAPPVDTENAKSEEATLLSKKSCLTTNALKRIKGPFALSSVLPWLKFNENADTADQSKKPKPTDDCFLSPESLQLKKSKHSRTDGPKSRTPWMQEQTFVHSFKSRSSWIKIRENLNTFKESKYKPTIDGAVRKPRTFSSILQKWKNIKSTDDEDSTTAESRLTKDKFMKSQFLFSGTNSFEVQIKKPTQNVTLGKSKKLGPNKEDDLKSPSDDRTKSERISKNPNEVKQSYQSAIKPTPTTAVDASIPATTSPTGSKTHQPASSGNGKAETLLNKDVDMKYEKKKISGVSKAGKSKKYKPTETTALMAPAETTIPTESKKSKTAVDESLPESTSRTESKKPQVVTSGNGQFETLSNKDVDIRPGTSGVSASDKLKKPKPSETTTSMAPAETTVPTESNKSKTAVDVSLPESTLRTGSKKPQVGTSGNGKVETLTDKDVDIKPGTSGVSTSDKLKKHKPSETTASTAPAETTLPTESNKSKTAVGGKTKFEPKLTNKIPTSATAKETNDVPTSDKSKKHKPTKTTDLMAPAETTIPTESNKSKTAVGGKPKPGTISAGDVAIVAETTTDITLEGPTTDTSKKLKPTKVKPATAKTKEAKKSKTVSKGTNKLGSKQDSPNGKVSDSVLAHSSANQQPVSIPEMTKKLKSSKPPDDLIKVSQEVLLKTTPLATITTKADDSDTKNVAKTANKSKENVQVVIQNAAKPADKGKEDVGKTTSIEASDPSKQLSQTGASETTAKEKGDIKHGSTFTEQPKTPDSTAATSILKKKAALDNVDDGAATKSSATNKKDNKNESTLKLQKNKQQTSSDRQANQPEKFTKTPAADTNAKTTVGKPTRNSASSIKIQKTTERSSTESKRRINFPKIDEPSSLFGQRPVLQHEMVNLPNFREEHKPIETPRHPEEGYYKPVHIPISDFLNRRAVNLSKVENYKSAVTKLEKQMELDY